MSKVAGVPGNGDTQDVLRRGPWRSGIDGQTTPEHCRPDEDGAGRTTCCVCRRNEGAAQDCAEYGREAAKDEGAANPDCQQGRWQTTAIQVGRRANENRLGIAMSKSA